MADFRNELSVNGVPVSLSTHTHTEFGSGRIESIGYAESLTSSNTTSTTYQTKVTLNLTLSASTTIQVFCSGTIYNSNTNRQVLSRIIVDDTTVVGESTIRMSQAALRSSVPNVTHRLTLASGSHTIKLQYCCAAEGGTSYIYNASITAHKII
jgi:hypothetical protein